MNFSALIIKLFIFAVLLVIGYLMARKGIISGAFSTDASKLVVNVFIAASIVNSVIGDRPDISNSQLWHAMFCLTVVLVFVFVCGFLTSLIYRHEENAQQTEAVMSMVNTLFVGLPVVGAVSGNEAMFYVGISCVPFNILVYSYGVWRLRKGKGKIRVRDMMSPPLISSVIAMILFIANLPMPRLITDLVGTVSGATVPVSMIVIGATMAKINPAEVFREKRTYILSVIRLIVVPVLAYFLISLLTDNEVLKLCCVVLAGCPAGIVVTPLSIQYGYDPQYSSKLVMATTVLCMITLPLLIYIFF